MIDLNLKKKIDYARRTASPDVELALSSILPLLGIPYGPDVLQSSIACPFCDHKQFYVYALGNGEHWHDCRNCGHHGDLVELASAIWKLPLEATLQKLHEKGLLSRVPLLGSSMPNNPPIDAWSKRHAILTFWEKATERARVGGGHGLIALRSQMGAPRETTTRDTSPEDWASCMSELIGEARAKEVNALFHPAARRDNGLVLPNETWKYVLVFPFYEAPNYMSSFLFVRPNGDPDKGDYRYFTFGTVKTPSTPDAGLWGLSAVVTSDSKQVLAFQNMRLAMRLQYQNSRESRKPAPIVCWYGDEKRYTSTSWTTLGNRRVIFVSEAPTAQLLRQVKIANGILVFHEMKYSQSRFWKDNSIDNLLLLLGDQAKSLPLAMADWLRQATPEQIQTLVLDCDRHGFDLRTELRAADRPRLEQARTLTVNTMRQLPAVQLALQSSGKKLHRVTENGSEWLLSAGEFDKTPVVACNCVLRIDRAITCAGRKQPVYEGRVLYRDQSFEFQVPASRLTKEIPTKTWLSNFLLTKTGIPLQANKLIANNLLTVALAFRQPELIAGSAKVGWVSEHQFQLPHLSVGQSGLSKLVRTTTMPGRMFREVKEPDFSGMRDNKPCQVFWAILALSVANILSRRYGRGTTGIGLLGSGAAAMGQFITQHVLDIPVFRETHGPLNLTTRMHYLEKRHDWPIYADELLVVNAAAKWLRHHSLEKNAIVALNPKLARGLSLVAPWRFVKATAEPRVMAWMQTEGPKIVPAYLETICRTPPEFKTERNFAKVVLEDLAHWVAEREGNPDHVLAAAEHWQLDLLTSRAKSVYEILAHAYLNGRISHVRIEFARDVRMGVFSVTDGPEPCLLVPPEAYVRAANWMGFGAVSTDAAEQVLRESGYLLGRQTDGPRPGWRLNLDIWEECLKGI